MEIRGLNKRGQNLPIGTIIIIVLGVAVLVFLIIGFTRGFDTFFEKLELVPGQLEAEAKACQLYVSSESKISFCEFREVEKDSYVNCEANIIQNNYDNVAVSFSCDDVQTMEDFCKEVGEGSIVNEFDCPEETEPPAE